ncbi:MAG: hypothetical protein LBI81_01975 [Puniceicoccales bacterium]|nr:hypothetical protein [Puniceicoccales bacterium]
MLNIFDRENFGKLLVRLVLGTILATNGVMAFVGGKTTLISLGEISRIIGFPWMLYFGWMMAVASIVCGITFAIGAFFRVSTFLLGTVILAEAICKYCIGHSFLHSVSYILMLSIAVYGFLFIGAGSYAVQKK